MTAPVDIPIGGSPDSDRATLEAERDRLLASLRDIESEHAAGDLPDADYQALRDGYTVRAAEVLRRLEARPEPPPPAAPADVGGDARSGGAGPSPGDRDGSDGSGRPGAPASRRSRRRLRIAIAAVGAALVVAGALVLVVGGSGSRQPGQTVSGNVPPSPAQELVAARQAMATGDQVMALRLYQAVLNVEPNQPEALAYSGWLLRLSGDVQKNRALIDAAVAAERASEAADPAYPDPHFFLGVILLDDLHDPAAAIPQLTAYLGSSPSPAVRKAVEPVLARARQEAGAPGSSSPGSTGTP
ncbi:MAG TPA: hypothetical protein VFH50_12320 [Acidimicrobiales bacterium]|nr:hypothetical protein [Acidimicrobiales bacterium]